MVPASGSAYQISSTCSHSTISIFAYNRRHNFLSQQRSLLESQSNLYEKNKNLAPCMHRMKLEGWKKWQDIVMSRSHKHKSLQSMKD